jgi:hypothetical protein
MVTLADLGIYNVRDVCFLRGFHAPTLAVLHQPLQTWAGRVATGTETCVVTVMSVNLDTHQNPVIWKTERLPYDSYRLVAIGSGAMLVLSHTRVTYCSQTQSLASDEVDADGARACVVADNLAVVTSRSGLMYAVELAAAGASVKRISLSPLACPAPARQFCNATCVSLLAPGLLFAGSRAEDSMLLRLSVRPAFERPAGDLLLLRPSAGPEDLEDLELEVLLYGRPLETAGEGAGRVVEVTAVLDTLRNAGPVSHTAVGVWGGLPAVVTCAGKTLQVLHGTVRGELLQSFEDKGCRGMWVIGRGQATTYALLARRSKTLVLQLNLEAGVMRELRDVTEFYPVTQNAGTFADGTLVQVHANGFSAFDPEQTKKLWDYMVVSGIAHSAVGPSHVALLLTDGSLHVATSDGKGRAVLQDSRVTSAWLLEGNLCVVVRPDRLDIHALDSAFPRVLSVTKEALLSAPVVLFGGQPMQEDDGPAGAAGADLNDMDITGAGVTGTTTTAADGNPTTTTTTTTTATTTTSSTNNAMDVDSSAAGATTDDAMQVVVQSGHIFVLEGGRVIAYRQTASHPGSNVLALRRVPMTSFGVGVSRILVSGEDALMLIYKNGRCAMGSFVRGEFRFFPLTPPVDPAILAAVRAQQQQQQQQQTQQQPPQQPQQPQPPQPLPISPHLLLPTHFARVQSSPFYLDWTPGGQRVRVCRLPEHQVPVPSGALRTVVVPGAHHVHRAVFHQQTMTYALSVSSPENGHEIVVMAGRGNGSVEYRFPLEAKEVVTCLEYIAFANPEDRNAAIVLLLAGTGTLTNEGEVCTGRMIVFDLVQRAGVYKIEKLHHKDEKKGPVTACAGLDGNAIVAVGQRLFVYAWKRGALMGLSFFDTNFYVSSIKVVRYMVIFADMFTGVKVVYWKPKRKQLLLLGADAEAAPALACEFLVDGTRLGYVKVGENRDLCAFSYSPEDPRSQGGVNLVPRSEARVPAVVTEIARYRLPNQANRHALVLGGGLGGGLQTVVPCNPDAAERLSLLAKAMSTRLVFACGLNPRAHFHQSAGHGFMSSAAAQAAARGRGGNTGFLDGNLLLRFLDLDGPAQTELCDIAGVPVAHMIKDIMDSAVWSL